MSVEFARRGKTDLAPRNARICALRATGLGFKEIGYRFGLSRAAVQKIVEQGKVALESRNAQSS